MASTTAPVLEGSGERPDCDAAPDSAAADPPLGEPPSSQPAFLPRTVSIELSEPPLEDCISTMKAERERLKSARHVVAKNLKNAKRRSSRLKRNTKRLSTNDLLEVLQQRRRGDSVVAAATPSGSSDS